MGQIRTYGQIGKAISCQSAQAVGTAVSKNPWLILIPCHRVLPSSGSLRKLCGRRGCQVFLTSFGRS
ncbi:methylated-DNA--[protein]-cysteine S-methyltransferase [Streptococcus thermophilus]